MTIAVVFLAALQLAASYRLGPDGAPLDVEVLCTFFKGNTVVAHGTGNVTVAPGTRLQTLEVRSPRAQPFEKATCSVESVKP